MAFDGFLELGSAFLWRLDAILRRGTVDLIVISHRDVPIRLVFVEQVPNLINITFCDI